MTQPAQPPTFPLSHAIAGAIATLGALVSMVNIPTAEPQRAELWLPALAYWAIAMAFQLLVAAGHVRTAILDRQHLVGSPPFERRGAWAWVLVHFSVLGLIAVFYWQASGSLPLLSGQGSSLAALLITNLASLAVWSVRLSAGTAPQGAAASEEPMP